MRKETKVCPHCNIELSAADWPDETPCPVCGMEPDAPPEDADNDLPPIPKRGHGRTTPLTKLFIWICILAALGGAYAYKFGLPFTDAPPLSLEAQCSGWKKKLEASLRKSNDQALTAASLLAKNAADSKEYQDVLELVETSRQEQLALSDKLRACPDKYRVELPKEP